MASSESSTSIFCSQLVKFKSNDVLGKVLRLYEEQLTYLLHETFGPGYLIINYPEVPDLAVL